MHRVLFEVIVFLSLLLSFASFAVHGRWQLSMAYDYVLVALLACSALVAACSVAVESPFTGLKHGLFVCGLRMSVVAGAVAVPLCSAYAVVGNMALGQVTTLLVISILLVLVSALLVGFIACQLRAVVRRLRRKIAVVGCPDLYERVRELAMSMPGALDIVGFLDLDSGQSEASKFPTHLDNVIETERIDSVAALISRTRALELIVAVRERRAGFKATAGLPVWDLLDLKGRGVRVSDFAVFWERYTGQVDLKSLHPASLVFAATSADSRAFEFGKRAFDVMCSIALLLLTLPLTILSAVLIKVSSPGSVLFPQERVGLHGQTFTLLKFRTMHSNAEDGCGPRWACHNDPRITPCGLFLRRTRIDELPQLLNVLKGDMSIIGPRPERPHFVSMLRQSQPYYDIRHHVKPGLTGWAQVSQGYASSLEQSAQKLSYDLYYIKYRSVLLELLIILRTIGVVLYGENAR